MKIKGISFVALLCVLGAFFIISHSLKGSAQNSPSLKVSTPTGAADSDTSRMSNLIKPRADIDPSNVYSFECELVLKRPDLMTTNCADFGEVVRDIKWSKWSAEGAVGKGIYSVNDCNPDCADGKRHEEPVLVQLKDLTTDGEKYYLNTLVIFTPTGDSKPVNGIEWDISEYFRNTLSK